VSPVAISADRRFHRAHVKPARRRGAWRTAAAAVVKYALLLAALVLIVTRGAAFVSQSPLLHITRIRPTGNQRMLSADVREALSGLEGQHILFADLETWRAKLLESPWVRDASFRRSLPSTIDVVVQERTPIAIGRIGGRLYLVDERGRAIDEFGPQYGMLDLPIVDGFSRHDGKRGAVNADGDQAGDDARGALAARLILALRQKPAIAKRLSQVDVSDVHNATMLLNDDPAELRVGDDHFLERVEFYLSLSSALRERVPDIDYVDLRFDGRVYVRPVGKPGAGRPTATRVNDAAHR
jgi:cell division protein FtsQ